MLLLLSVGALSAVGQELLASLHAGVACWRRCMLALLKGLRELELVGVQLNLELCWWVPPRLLTVLV